MEEQQQQQQRNMMFDTMHVNRSLYRYIVAAFRLTIDSIHGI